MRNKTILFTELAIVAVLLLSFAIVGFITVTKTPQQLGPAALTFWFIGVLMIVASLLCLLDYNLKLRKEDNRMQPKKAFLSSLRTGVLFGFTFAILLALSSLRSLGIRDIILFILTVLLIELYFRTRKSS